MLILTVVELPDQPLGMVQLYVVAPETDAIEYVFPEPLQIAVFPEMVPGVAGMLVVVIANVAALLVPHPF